MATQTPNLNLWKPEATDPFKNFRQLFNDNMDILDNGGGGSGGHTIVDENGSDMPAEGKLQFTGNVSVTDDNVNGKTIVDILGGGGNVYGAFIDTNRVLASGVYSYSSPLNYTATEDCFACVSFVSSDGDKNVYGYIDGELIFRLYDNSNVTVDNQIIPLKKGQVLRVETSRNDNDSPYKVYGTTQGTNGIFTPIIYSDSERVVGVWRDNKTLYQKCINYGNLPNNGGRSVAHGIANVDKIFIVGGYVTTGTAFYNLEHATDSSYDWSSRVDTTNVTIETLTDRSTLTAIVVVQYTKTTDSAGSGTWNTDGVPTVHYSTAEQVIGTWIDGKPLYAKTINFGSIPSNATKEVDHNISDLKMTIGFEGTMMSGTVCETLPSGENSSFRIQTTSSKLKIITGASWSGWNDSYITIKYTKTTD